MADLNHITLSGNLVRDPELKQAGGKNVCELRLGTKLYGDKSAFTDVTVWGGQSSTFDLAETVANAFSKGDRIQLTGRLGYDEWTDKEGNKRSKHFVTAADIVLPPKGQSATPDTSGEPTF